VTENDDHLALLIDERHEGEIAKRYPTELTCAERVR
jgi:hypothetical protein